MSTTIPIEEIIGAKEVGKLAGMSDNMGSQWAARHTSFPRPIKVLDSGPLYDRREVVKWLRNTGRLKVADKPQRDLGLDTPTKREAALRYLDAVSATDPVLRERAEQVRSEIRGISDV